MGLLSASRAAPGPEDWLSAGLGSSPRMPRLAPLAPAPGRADGCQVWAGCSERTLGQRAALRLPPGGPLAGRRTLRPWRLLLRVPSPREQAVFAHAVNAVQGSRPLRFRLAVVGFARQVACDDLRRNEVGIRGHLRLLLAGLAWVQDAPVRRRGQGELRPGNKAPRAGQARYDVVRLERISDRTGCVLRSG